MNKNRNFKYVLVGVLVFWILVAGMLMRAMAYTYIDSKTGNYIEYVPVEVGIGPGTDIVAEVKSEKPGEEAVKMQPVDEQAPISVEVEAIEPEPGDKFEAFSEEITDPPVVIPNPYKSIVVNLTDYEMDLLMRILWVEANNQCFEGQVAVIESIFNRVISPKWPNTIEDVLSQVIGGYRQFASWPLRNKKVVKPGEMQRKAIEHVLTNGPTQIPTDYVYFATKDKRWMHDCIKIQDHYFGR